MVYWIAHQEGRLLPVLSLYLTRDSEQLDSAFQISVFLFAKLGFWGGIMD